MSESPNYITYTKELEYEEDKDETDTVIIESIDTDPYLYVSASQPINLTAEFWCKKIKLNNELDKLVQKGQSQASTSMNSQKSHLKSSLRKRKTKLLSPMQNSASKDLNKDLWTLETPSYDIRGAKTPQPGKIGLPKTERKYDSYHLRTSDQLGGTKNDIERRLRDKLKQYKKRIKQKQKAKAIFRFFRGTGSADKFNKEHTLRMSTYSPSHQKVNPVSLFETEGGIYQIKKSLIETESSKTSNFVESADIWNIIFDKWKVINKEPPTPIVTAFSLSPIENT